MAEPDYIKIYTLSFPAYARDATGLILYVIAFCQLSFPAYARDATASGRVRPWNKLFHFPLMREMQRHKPMSMDYIRTFHFPLMREMQQLSEETLKYGAL